jgi:hypothetical protein
MIQTNFLRSTTRANNIITIPDPVDQLPFTLGGLQAFGGPSPYSLDITQPVQSIAEITLDPAYVKGNHRIIGIGFEAHNTTAELYRQGSVTIGSVPEQARAPSTYLVNSPTRYCSLSATPLSAPPQTLDDATLIPGSRTWNASEGCYMVGRFASTLNPPYNCDYDNPMLMTVDDQPGLNGDYVFLPQPIPASVNQYASPVCHLNPINQPYAWFNGLSYQSTINLTLTTYIETFPSISEKDIIVLSRPSPDFDPLALEIMSHAIGSMPFGVPVAENFDGDWWADVINQVANLLDYIPHPMAQIASKIGRFSAPMVKGYGTTPATLGYQAGTAPTAPPRTSSIIVAAPTAPKKKKKKEKST